MRALIALVLASSLVPWLADAGAAQAPDDYAELRARAETLFAEGSFALALELYERADALELGEAESRWVDFRLADCGWRSAAATDDPDTTRLERAREALLELQRPVERPEDRDLVWAEVEESLGDYQWERQGSSNYHGALPHYRAALDWWAASPDIETARGRYLAMIFRMARPAWYHRHWDYGYYGNWIDDQLLRNALSIAVEPGDVARAHYLLGQSYARSGEERLRARVIGEFEAALALGRETAWYDDALYRLGVWYEEQGEYELDENGRWRHEPDYVRAVEFHKRLMREHREGESRRWRSSRDRILKITGTEVAVSVGHVFLPGSKLRYGLRWRNAKRVELSLYATDMTRDVHFARRDEQDAGDWLSVIDVRRLERVASWNHETGDEGLHVPGQAELDIEQPLAPGAYVLVASAHGESSRELVLITDAALVTKASGDQLLAWFCDAEDGEPIADAELALWERYYDGGAWLWRSAQGATRDDGTHLFELYEGTHSSEIYVGARLGERQAFAVSSTPWRGQNYEPWRIYAVTDRPAYRPLDTVSWKVTAREYDGKLYSTPVGRKLYWVVNDARGTQVAEGSFELNAFGSAWGELETTEAMALGEFNVQFYADAGQRNHLGWAQLFRLEEYKLPEFEVSVKTAEVDGAPQLFKVGDEVELEIGADYYFGGPVREASVEVLIHQRPYAHRFEERHEYPWLHQEADSWSWNYWYGPGELVHQETLKTDDAGRARVRFETPADAGQDYEYTVTARITDASRREVEGSAAVRVTRQAYYVRVEPEHRLHAPRERVSFELDAVDANRNPVAATGQVRITREVWRELWRDPAGQEVTGLELAALRRRLRIFPPPPAPGSVPWQLISQGYESVLVEEFELTTDAEGRASFGFLPLRDGYYKATWTSRDPRGGRVVGEGVTWVCSVESRELGYRNAGVELVLDEDSFRAGEVAPVMLVVPRSNRWVLFTAVAERLHEYSVVHVSGTVKLVRVELGEEHVPNVFFEALTFSEGMEQRDTREVIVPPVEHFLEIEVAADAEAHEPGEPGSLTVTARDVDGQPVQAELSVAMIDASVTAIGQDLAGDPRQFFFGTKRDHRCATGSTTHHQRYARLVELEDGRVLEERQAILERELEHYRDGWGAPPAGAPASGGVGVFDSIREMEALGYSGRARRSDTSAGADDFYLGEGLVSNSVRYEASQEKVSRDLGLLAGAVEVRHDFRETALWRADVETDADGRAQVEFSYPDSVTRWEATVRAADSGARFGIGEAATRTRKPLIARLQAPRFFVVGDELLISTNVGNESEEDLDVEFEFAAAGLEVLGLAMDNAGRLGDNGPIPVPAGSQQRLDWLVRVVEPGTATLRVALRAGDYSDGVERSLPVYPHGVESMAATAGKVRADEALAILDLPAERAAGSTRFEVQVTPSLAVTMLDALPYLVDYPYGCSEQTLSRFLPAVVVARTLESRGLSAEEAMGRVFGGVEAESADQTHRREYVSLDELDEVVKNSLARLYDMQHSDGGWGWWKHGDSDDFMTAYVLWGLELAREAGVQVDGDTLRNAARYLDLHLVEKEAQPDIQAWMLHALALHGARGGAHEAEFAGQAFDNLWQQRVALNAYTRALFALSAHAMGRDGEAGLLVRNLANGAIIDEAPETSLVQRGEEREQEAVQGTAHWGEDGVWYRWSRGGVEATAFALRALLAIDPDNELVEPVTNWLIQNRRGSQWSNTRDTAICVLALDDYLEASGELGRSVSYEVLVNGQRVAERSLEPADILAAPGRFEVDPELVVDGENRVVVRRTAGEGPLYFSASAEFFSLEEPVQPRGNQIFVRREYFRLVGRPTLLAGYVYDRVALEDGDVIASGERVEVVLTVEAKNHYEYLVFEDLKPAGLEATQVQSGESLYARELKASETEHRFGEDADPTPAVRDSDFSGRGRYGWGRGEVGYTGRTRWVHQELRDRKVALFLDKLPQGVWEIRYDLRAEVPGAFHALPTLGHAMYVPEIRCNGAEIRLTVTE